MTRFRFRTNAVAFPMADSTRRAPSRSLALCYAAAGILLAQAALGSPTAGAVILRTQPSSGTTRSPSTISLSAGAAPVDAAYFDHFVRPVLERSCLGCHGVGARIDGLDLSSRESALRGGTRGPALVPGNASKSRLFEMITGVRTPQMPPTGKLPSGDIKIIQRWLNGGAPWAGPAIRTARKQVWWAFRLPTAAPVPVFHDTSWAKNPIDAFVLARLRSHGLTPSPPAPRAVLIRRAFLDMLGILPTPYEVHAFEMDRSPDAWEKVVDRLLASPRYGERWGRHWLDLVRYADSGGFEGDRDRPYAWRYRDYVLDSFNRDRPYDTFLKEQIAGDELHPDDSEALIATGYLACGPQDIVMQNAKNRADELDDLVATTGSAFLGLTTGCARCHDHKYDPIKQTDYYRLSAVFAPCERREVDVPTPEQRRAASVANAGLDREEAPLKASLRPLDARGRTAAIAAGHATPTPAEIAAALPAADRAELTRLTASIAAIDGRRPVFPRAEIVTDSGPTFPPVHLLIRGDATHPGPVVQPGFIAALPGGDVNLGPDDAVKTGEKTTTGRRLALANWIASASNPLTARVWMNRVWQHHFGEGLVSTPSNFGVSGDLPTHPELLDWLAVKFEADGWRLKPIQRMILLSNTYQQSSDRRGRAAAIDPAGRLLWRMPLQRLDAEVIRDNILYVAGSLNEARGGPPVYPPVDASLRADTFQGPNWKDGEDGPSTWRRSVYVKVKRSLLLPELEVFDCPEISQSVAKRNVTTTPTQALTLLNDPLIRRQAGIFAARLRREAGDDPVKQIRLAYNLAFCRDPSARETGIAAAFLAENGPTALVDFCHALFNLNEFVYAP